MKRILGIASLLFVLAATTASTVSKPVVGFGGDPTPLCSPSDPNCVHK
jgi:hypothetical protein